MPDLPIWNDSYYVFGIRENYNFATFLITIYSINIVYLPYNFGHPTMVEQRYCPIFNLTKISLIISEFQFISNKTAIFA